MQDLNALIQAITVIALPVIFAITLHEAAHGYVAWRFGDPTAWQLGRVTLNPLPNIDFFGTLLLPIILYVLSDGKFLFGYTNIPVNFHLLRNPKRDMLWVAAAGPAANLLMACFWALMFKLSWALPQFFSTPLALMAGAGITINCVLMVLNLIPLPPFDGGRIAISLLPEPLSSIFARIEPLGFPILLVLMFTGILGAILNPLVDFSTQAISAIFGLY